MQIYRKNANNGKQYVFSQFLITFVNLKKTT